MKKIFAVLCVFLILVVAAACGKENEEIVSEEELNISLEILEKIYQEEYLWEHAYEFVQQEPYGPEEAPISPTFTERTWPEPPEVLTLEDLLYDFDYLSNILSENFPFYGPALRKLGLDLHIQKDRAAEAISGMVLSGDYRRDSHRFADIILTYIISPMRSMGHISGMQAGTRSFDIQLGLILNDMDLEIPWFPRLYGNYLYGMFTSPAAFRFYGQEIVRNNADALIQSTFVQDNLSFNIIRQDSIAYMRMHSMNFANFENDSRLIEDFFDSIGHFEHLIIDLRGNRGGNAANFMFLVMAPLIDEPASLFYYVFLKQGEHALMFDEFYYLDAKWQSENGLANLYTDGPRLSVRSMVDRLPEANPDDFRYLEIGFMREITVEPSINPADFRGKIWILIDGSSLSAAEISAALAGNSGFATLVGSPTAGIFGGYTAAFVSLPNTGMIVRYDYGYVTDLNGRSFEEFGVMPHISNRPGMDALATVLALIDEGSY